MSLDVVDGRLGYQGKGCDCLAIAARPLDVFGPQVVHLISRLWTARYTGRGTGSGVRNMSRHRRVRVVTPSVKVLGHVYDCRSVRGCGRRTRGDGSR